MLPIGNQPHFQLILLYDNNGDICIKWISFDTVCYAKKVN